MESRHYSKHYSNLYRNAQQRKREAAQKSRQWTRISKKSNLRLDTGSFILKSSCQKRLTFT